MALRDWNGIAYLPILSLRPAEMRALEELPNRTKDLLLPIVHLRPWVGAHRLESATDRIAKAYGTRPIIIAMGEQEPPDERSVYTELASLRTPKDGFHQWGVFFQRHKNYIPAIQFSPETPEEEQQITRLFGLNRGLVVIIERQIFNASGVIAKRVGERTGGGQNVCFVLDFGSASRDHLEVAAQATGLIDTIRNHAPTASIAVSASSFPESFVGLPSQEIYERKLFNSLPRSNGLIYSDRGSARAEPLAGGGGQPAPRIDYPLFDSWKFYRADNAVGFAGYKAQAELLMKTTDWNPRLRVWGTQMIERTAAGDTSAIGGTQKATAARINLHLQQQTFYASPANAEDTDEDWSG